MLRRIPDLFAFVDVSHRLGIQLFDVPLHNYAAHTWHGGVYRGERRAAILKTGGSDNVAHTLAFTTMHLVQRVGDSGVDGYDVVVRDDGDREASRLAGLFAGKLIDCVTTGIEADEERIGFAAQDPHLERTLTSYRAVAEIMYPDSREMRYGVTNVDDDPIAYWRRALDHALFIGNADAHAPASEAMLRLARTIDDTIDSYYVYFLATSFGNAMYERFGL